MHSVILSRESRFAFGMVSVVLLIAPVLAWAQDAAPGPDACFDGPPSVRVEELMDRWERHDPVGQAFARRTDITVVRGTALVGKSAYEKDWGSSRSVAYVRAYLNAMREFVQKRRSDIRSETVRDYLADDNGVIEASDPASYFDRIETKHAALVEKKLDNALREEGLSKSEIEELTAPEKVIRFRDSVTRRSTIEASGSASGLVPVKTVEVVNCDGDTAIGVVLASSRKMGVLAAQVANGEPLSPDPQRAGKTVAEQLNSLADADLVTEFGIRRWWDDQGYPVIIAFGQRGWYSANLNNRQKDRAWRFAKEQAEAEARGYLSEFINLGTLFVSESERGSVAEEATIRHSSGIGEDVDVENMIDRLVRTAQTESRVALTGLSTLRTWSATHPLAKDQELVGAVVYWSPALEDSTRKGLGLSTKHAPPEPTEERRAAPEASRVEGGTTESKVQTDAADF